MLAAMRSRLGGRLSGGEQQMLTIARTLMGNPDLLLLDEPSEGLAPIIVEKNGELIQRLRGMGHAGGRRAEHAFLPRYREPCCGNRQGSHRVPRFDRRAESKCRRQESVSRRIGQGVVAVQNLVR
jgi:hypothetical protein